MTLYIFKPVSFVATISARLTGGVSGLMNAGMMPAGTAMVASLLLLLLLPLLRERT